MLALRARLPIAGPALNASPTQVLNCAEESRPPLAGAQNEDSCIRETWVGEDLEVNIPRETTAYWSANISNDQFSGDSNPDLHGHAPQMVKNRHYAHLSTTDECAGCDPNRKQSKFE